MFSWEETLSSVCAVLPSWHRGENQGSERGSDPRKVTQLEFPGGLVVKDLAWVQIPGQKKKKSHSAEIQELEVRSLLYFKILSWGWGWGDWGAGEAREAAGDEGST